MERGRHYLAWINSVGSPLTKVSTIARVSIAIENTVKKLQTEDIKFSWHCSDMDLLNVTSITSSGGVKLSGLTEMFVLNPIFV